MRSSFCRAFGLAEGTPRGSRRLRAGPLFCRRCSLRSAGICSSPSPFPAFAPSANPSRAAAVPGRPGKARPLGPLWAPAGPPRVPVPFPGRGRRVRVPSRRRRLRAHAGERAGPRSQTSGCAPPSNNKTRPLPAVSQSSPPSLTAQKSADSPVCLQSKCCRSVTFFLKFVSFILYPKRLYFI